MALAGGAESEPSSTMQRMRVTRVELLCCVVITGSVSVLLALAFGRDLNWDFFNYHLYSGLLLAQGRLTQDFMAAGYQGYMNPLPYLPLYLMTAAKWHSMVIASVIALVQSLNFVFLYLISRQAVGAARHPRLAAGVTTALGACSVVVLGQLGSSFIDLTTAWPVLAAVWLLLLPTTSARLLLIGGLLGIATGLKLTNIVFAFGAFVTVAWRHRSGWTQALQHLALWSAGAVLGVLLVYGYWGVQLQQHFGSPVFPMFNQIFKAPDFAEVPIQNNRFLPGTVGELLSLPWRMLELKGWVYVENQAPDLRPLVLLVLVGCASVAGLFNAFRRRTADPAVTKSGSTAADSHRRTAFRTMGVFVAASLLAWVPTSSNGRYATPILMLLGPLLYITVRRLATAQASIAVCAALLGLQITHISHAGNPHWSPTAWVGEWLPAEIPASLREKPHLILNVGASSESYVAAYVHPDSVIVNPIGLISIANYGPGWTRLQTLIDKHRGRIQVIFPAPPEPSSVIRKDGLSYLEKRNALVDRLGLGFEPSTCQTLSFNAGPASAAVLDQGLDNRPRRLLACAAARVAQPNSELAAARVKAIAIMNAIEDRCPSIFGPSRAQVEGFGDLWVRLYGKYDLYLAVNLANSEVYYRMEHQNVDTVIGHVESIEADIDKFQCRLPRDGKRGL